MGGLGARRKTGGGHRVSGWCTSILISLISRIIRVTKMDTRNWAFVQRAADAGQFRWKSLSEIVSNGWKQQRHQI